MRQAGVGSREVKRMLVIVGGGDGDCITGGNSVLSFY